MDRNALAELLQALESRRDAEERRREERYTALIERRGEGREGAARQDGEWREGLTSRPVEEEQRAVQSQGKRQRENSIL
ncbi:UNVERIFIED_CONTAM: hypothetical protein FKN15_023223 [Acipenser sinensis]